MSKQQKQQPKQRLPYEPPAVVSSQPFETLALACAKQSPVVLTCRGAITS